MEEIRKNLNTGKLILGTKSTIKAMRKGLVQKIFLANNCPEIIREDLEHYASITGVELEKLTYACDELGAVCKKPFMISVVALVK